jgi:Reverse transcriptase (RNA-dependent DNA polymerase)
VAKMNTVRILFSIAVNKDWNLHQMDVKNAFIQGTLEEEVYMTLPPAHKMEQNSNLVCRLKKAIYGIRQSSRSWYDKLSHFFYFPMVLKLVVPIHHYLLSIVVTVEL